SASREAPCFSIAALTAWLVCRSTVFTCIDFLLIPGRRSGYASVHGSPNALRHDFDGVEVAHLRADSAADAQRRVDGVRAAPLAADGVRRAVARTHRTAGADIL